MIGERRSCRPLRLMVLLLFAAGVVLLPAAAVGQQAPASPGLTVAENDADSHFPDGVTFSLTATATDPIARVELLYAAAGDETLQMAMPTFSPDRDIAVEQEIDLRAASLPPGIDVTYRWRLIDGAGGAVETEPRTLLWADDRFDWSEAAGERVTVHAYTGDPIFEQAVLETAERTIDRLELRFGVRWDDPIRIWVYDSMADLAGALRPNTEPWVAGASYPEHGLILAVLPVANAGEIGRVVPHEISHQLLHRATANPFNEPPTWLNEGLAVHAQEGGDQGYPALVAEAATEGRLESIAVLNAPFPYDQDAARLAYAQSLSIVTFILDTYGADGMARLIGVHREGVTADQAVRRALGVSLVELDRRWRANLPVAAETRRAATNLGQRSDEGDELGTERAIALASGALVMGGAAILATVAGALAFVRSRRARLEAGDWDE